MAVRRKLAARSLQRRPVPRAAAGAAARRTFATASTPAGLLQEIPTDTYEAYIPPITAHYSGQGFEPYQWHTAAPNVPVAPPPDKPLYASTLGLLATSGGYVSGEHLAYSYKDDASIRHIRTDASADELRFSHITENYLVAGRSDPNCLLPLGTLNKMMMAGELGAVAPTALSCMGGIYSVRRVVEELAPQVVASFHLMEVDAVLMVPM